MKNQKICILGAGGSIGSRLVGLLLSQGYSVTAVVRSLSSAVRIGRFDIPIVAMDLLSTSKEALAAVVVKHDVVIDCTFSSNNDYDQRLVEAQQLAELICDAAKMGGVERLIHYGTISVYPTNVGVVDETTHCEMRDDAYGDSKLVAEAIFLSRSTELLAVTVLQLPIVFGAFMGWSVSPVVQMSEQRLLMPNDISGQCSPLYVDDVVSATISTFDCPESHGQRILLSDKPITWSDYYSAYAGLSEQLEVHFIERLELNDLYQQQKNAMKPFQRLKEKFSNDGDFRQMILAQWGVSRVYKWLKRYRGQSAVDKIKTQIARSVHVKHSAGLAGKVEVALDPRTLSVLDGIPAVNADKSRTILKFEAYTPFDQAISHTGEWLKWARLVK